VLPVGEQEIATALKSGFKDFEDAIQYFSARSEPGLQAILTRNKDDYAKSEIPVMSAEEYLMEFDAKNKIKENG